MRSDVLGGRLLYWNQGPECCNQDCKLKTCRLVSQTLLYSDADGDEDGLRLRGLPGDLAGGFAATLVAARSLCFLMKALSAAATFSFFLWRKTRVTLLFA